jgi:hypothetical protein
MAFVSLLIKGDKTMLKTLCIVLLATVATYGEGLKPKHLKPGKTVYQNDFSTSAPLNKTHWQVRQGTRWSIEDGVLKGIPSSAEYQAKKKATGKGHTGNIPRIYMLNTPQDFILSYRFKLEGGKPSGAVPLVEFGHHVSRVYFSPEGPRLLADHEEKTLAKIATPLELDRWYTVLVEAKGDAIVVQIEGIGTMSVKDSFLGKTERPIIGFTGNVNGTSISMTSN